MSDDEMDFSFLDAEWKARRALQISEELSNHYMRFMRDLAPQYAQQKAEATLASVPGATEAMAAQVAWQQVAAQGVLTAVAMYLARHEDDPTSVPQE